MPFQRKAEKKAQPTIQVPSLYGSHRSMIEEGTEPEDGWVVLRDEKGVYSTPLDRLDTGLADPRRYADRVVTTPNVKAVIKP